MKVNFKEFTIPTGISKKNRQTGDARESFADLVYMKGSGIAAHALALKIYQSEGGAEYSQEEVALMRKVAAAYCSPAFIDGLEEQLAGVGGTGPAGNTQEK